MSEAYQFAGSQEQLFTFLTESLKGAAKQLDDFMMAEQAKTAMFLRGIVEEHGKALQATTKATTDHLASTLDAVQGTDKHTQSTKMHKESLSDLGSAFKDLLEPANLFGASVKLISDNFEMISWGLVVNSMRSLALETSGLYRSLGADNGQLSQFTGQLAGLETSAHLSNVQLIELGQAFRAEGLSLSQNVNPDLNEYIKVSGQAMNLFGLSAEGAAKFSAQMRESGHTAGDVRDSFDDLYKTMQINNFSIGELSGTIVEASSMMDKFGALAGESVNKLAHDLLGTKSLLRSLGVDAKFASEDISNVLGNVHERIRQASAISALTGQSQAHVFSMLGSASGEKLRSETFLQQMKSNLPQMAFQDQSKLSDESKESVATQVSMQSDFYAKTLGIKPDEANQLLEPFFAKMRSGFKGSVDDYVTEMEKAHKSQAPAASFTDGLKGYNSSLAAFSANAQHTLDAVLILLGGPLMTVLNPLIAGLNQLLDVAVNLVNNPIGQWAVGLAEVVMAFMTGMTLLPTAVAAVSGSFALIASVGGLLVNTVTGVIGALGAFTAVAEGTATFGTILAGLGAEGAAVSGGFALVVSVAGALANTIGGIVASTGLIAAVLAGVETFSEVIAGISAVALTIADPLAWVAAGIIGLGAAVAFLVPHIKDLSNFFGGLFGGGAKGANPTTQLVNAQPVVDYFFSKLQTFLDQMIYNLGKVVGDFIRNAPEALIQYGGELIQGAVKTGGDVLNGAVQLGSGAVQAFGEGLKGQPAAAAEIPMAAPTNATMGLNNTTNLVDIGHGFKLRADAATAFQKAQDLAKAHGQNILVNSAYRSDDEQYKLHQDYLHHRNGVPLAAMSRREGGKGSEHEDGLSLDIQNWQTVLPYLKEAGFVHGNSNGKALPTDPVHFSLAAPSMTTPSATAVNGIAPPPNAGGSILSMAPPPQMDLNNLGAVDGSWLGNIPTMPGSGQVPNIASFRKQPSATDDKNAMDKAHHSEMVSELKKQTNLLDSIAKSSRAASMQPSMLPPSSAGANAKRLRQSIGNNVT